MAVIDIIANSKKEQIDWEIIQQLISKRQFQSIELFPIPMQLGFKTSAFGICVPSKKCNDFQIVISEIRLVVNSFEEAYDFKELYNGNQITSSNCEEICLALMA